MDVLPTPSYRLPQKYIPSPPYLCDVIYGWSLISAKQVTKYNTIWIFISSKFHFPRYRSQPILYPIDKQTQQWPWHDLHNSERQQQLWQLWQLQQLHRRWKLFNGHQFWWLILRRKWHTIFRVQELRLSNLFCQIQGHHWAPKALVQGSFQAQVTLMCGQKCTL